MNEKKTIKSSILIDFRKNRITISNHVLRLIDEPKFILLLVNPEARTLAVLKSDETERRAYRIRPANNRRVELYSKGLLKTLLGVSGNWQENYSYRIAGEISQDGIVTFHIDNAALASEAKE